MTFSLLRGILPYFSSSVLRKKPNAAPQPLPEAGARHERTLEAVGCRRLFGAGSVSRHRVHASSTPGLRRVAHRYGCALAVLMLCSCDSPMPVSATSVR